MPGRASGLRQRAYSSSHRAARRQTSWTAAPGGTVVRTGSGSTLFVTGLVPLVEGLTITRIRGEFLCWLSTAAASADQYVGGVGIMLVPDEAFAAGVASVPTPIDDIDYEEWMWYDSFCLTAAIGAIATDEPSYPGTQFKRIQIDSKSMRKFPVGKTMCAVVEVTETGAATFNACLQARTLVILA